MSALREPARAVAGCAILEVPAIQDAPPRG